MTIRDRLKGYGEGWRQRKWVRRMIILVVIVLVVVGGWFLAQRGDKEDIGVEKALPRVEVMAFKDLVDTGEVEKVAVVESVGYGPLIARTGGRVTRINTSLGSNVRSGQLVVEIDGGSEANVAQAQLNSAGASLNVFHDIERLALLSSDNAVEMAKLSLKAARAGDTLSEVQVRKAREQADLTVRGAELALQDQIDSDSSTDVLTRTADIALQTAQLAQDQATIALQTANQQGGDAVKQAEKGLAAARLTREKLNFDLNSQKIAIQGQVAVAREQVKLAQVMAPMAGQVTRLSVRVGDFVGPGEIVGEVLAYEGAQVSLDVAAGVREKLEMGQLVSIDVNGEEVKGEVVRLAGGPSAVSSLWQVDVVLIDVPDTVYPGDLVTVKLPVGAQGQNTMFVPLDVVAVRQDGIVLFTVGEDNVVQEHEVKVVGYAGDFVEGLVEGLLDDMQIVTEGNRTLQAGETVEVVS